MRGGSEWAPVHRTALESLLCPRHFHQGAAWVKSSLSLGGMRSNEVVMLLQLCAFFHLVSSWSELLSLVCLLLSL